jgi:hypothetical protein
MRNIICAVSNKFKMIHSDIAEHVSFNYKLITNEYTSVTVISAAIPQIAFMKISLDECRLIVPHGVILTRK